MSLPHFKHQRLLSVALFRKVQTITTPYLIQRQKRWPLHYLYKLQNHVGLEKYEITTKCHLQTHMRMQHITSH